VGKVAAVIRPDLGRGKGEELSAVGKDEVEVPPTDYRGRTGGTARLVYSSDGGRAERRCRDLRGGEASPQTPEPLEQGEAAKEHLAKDGAGSRFLREPRRSQKRTVKFAGCSKRDIYVKKQSDDVVKRKGAPVRVIHHTSRRRT